MHIEVIYTVLQQRVCERKCQLIIYDYHENNLQFNSLCNNKIFFRLFECIQMISIEIWNNY